MNSSSDTDRSGIQRRKLFLGICLALVPTGASFALVSNILVQLKQEFILTNYQVGLIAGAALWGMAISLLVLGPLLEGFGLKNGARMAIAGHLIGITLLVSAVLRVGDPSAFWILMAGAATLAVGNGMIEVTGNPLVAALYPEKKTTYLNYFHAFFPIGIVLGGLTGFLLATQGGAFGRWPWQLAVIYIPVLVYGYMLLFERFPKTENAEAGVPVGEMFRYTLTNPLFLLMLAMMAITTSMELGPMRWVPAVLEAGGIHGILVLVWISGWMVVLRLLASHFVERLSPPGMLLIASILTGTGLFLLSFVSGLWSAFAAATIFAWGVAFFFPTMVGTVSERMPKTGSLGIVLTAGVGLGMAGLVGVPLMGKLADRYLAAELPAAETAALLQRVEQQFPAYVERAQSTTDLAQLGYREAEVADALAATRTALSEYEQTGSVQNDATANALRAVVGTAVPNEPLVGEARAILSPAEAYGGQKSFRYIAPAALILIAVFGTMYMNDRRRGGYRAVRLERARETASVGILVVLIAACGSRAAVAPVTSQAPMSASARAPAEQPVVAPPAERLRVLFLGDNGHHRPYVRAKEILPVLANNGIDMFYTDQVEDLNSENLSQYHTLVFYNNQPAISQSQMAALTRFLDNGGGLVVLHSASASMQNSEAFIRLVGAAFKSHGTGTFSATRVQPDHPVVRGVPVFETWDETYIHTKHNPARTVLEVHRENGHEEPWTWVRDYGDGRVFYTAWGHDQRTWSTDGFQRLVAQAIEWTAGDWALSRRLDEPTPEKVELDVPIPTYARPPAPWNTASDPVTEAPVALSTEESLQLATFRPGFKAEPFAFEPMIGNIIDFTWDARGRMWAIETNDYPNDVLPDSVVGDGVSRGGDFAPDAGPYPGGKDRILIIEDTNNDGRADDVKVFADGMNLATSLVLANGGVVVGQAPHMLFFQDTNGDDQADVREVMFTGFPRNDTHGTISNMRWGFDNRILASLGYNGFRGQVGDVTIERGAVGAGYFSFPPDGTSFDYIARTSNNTWGVALSEDNFIFGSTANSRPSNFVHIPGRYYRDVLGTREPVLPGIQDRNDVYAIREIWQVDQFDRYTAGAAHEIYTARLFPREYWNRVAFVTEPTAHVIGMFELLNDGSTFTAKNRWNLMASRDPWTAPVQVKVGPDGALWVSDFYTLIAQHNPVPRCTSAADSARLEAVHPLTCSFRGGAGAAYETPNRDRLHGRIYRILPEDAPAMRPMRLDDASPAELVETLEHDNLFWRMIAQQMLVEGGHTSQIPALVELVNDHTIDELGLNVAAQHALWTLHGLGAIPGNEGALAAARNALHHPAASVRRAALQVLPRDEHLLGDILAAGMLPDRSSPTPVEYTVPNSVLQDASPYVRVQALLAVAELPASPRAANALLEIIMVPGNAGDRWIPEAVAIAGVKQGPQFAADLVRRRLPRNADSLAIAGIRNTVRLMTEHYIGSANADAVVALLTAVPEANPAIGDAVLSAIAPPPPPDDAPPQVRARASRTGWPQDQPPTLSAEQRNALITAARAAAPELAEGYQRVVERWGMPDLFR